MPSQKTKRKSKQAKSKRAKSKPSKSKNVRVKSIGRTAQTKRARRSKPAKKVGRSKPARKKTVVTKTSRRGKTALVNPLSEVGRELQGKRLSGAGTGAGRRTSDFEGLSLDQQADSESVDELIEEGNVFEAGAVQGVEEADAADEREVHTHEAPEDDVPEEYLDKE